MNRSLAGILLVAGLLSASPVLAQCDRIPDCALIWSDEFDGSAVDPAKWEFQTGDGSQVGLPGWGNNELQWYQSANASVANGVLTIQARQQSVGGKAYTSSRLRSLGRAEFLYGRVEMRARLPVGKGLWPAFWMLPSDPAIYGVWAASGEIDVMESIGGDRIYGTIHYGGTFPANVQAGSSILLPAGSAADFHVYAVEWQPTEIRWYVDGQLYATRNDWFSTGGPYPAPFDVPFHLLLNVAVGGNFPGSPDGTTVFPQNYVVDYVRVYQQRPADPDLAARCGSDKVKAAGKHGKCAAAVFARALQRAEAVDAARLATCAARLDASFARAEARGGSSCPTTGDAASVRGDLDECVGATVTALGGVPGPGGATARCQSGKAKQAGKYLDCLLKTTAVAIRKGTTADPARCDARFAGGWDGLDAGTCLTSGDRVAQQAELAACHAAVAVSLSGPACGNGVPDPAEECDDGNTVSGDGCSAACRLQAEYRQDFEDLDAGDGAALADDGWLVFGNVFSGTTGGYLYGYGTFPAPNGGPAFSAIVSGEGGAAQGARQLVAYSDYNNGNHGSGNVVEANLFRERTITTADVGRTVTFAFDARRGDLAGATTAMAFVKTLDPNAGYATTRLVTQVTTAIPTTWARYEIALAIDAGLVGQVLQYGFASRATNYAASGVLYDNLMLLRTPTNP